MPPASLRGTVKTVACSPEHSFSKATQQSVRLEPGIGIRGDAHSGATMLMPNKRGGKDELPNTRQVHLMTSELQDEFRAKGFDIEPGAIGDNMTTAGVELLDLPLGAKLGVGASVVLEVTGLRNPCRSLEARYKGISKEMLQHDEEGNAVRRTGVFSVVLQGGEVCVGDELSVELPEPPYRPLPVL